ncbi:peptidoglycan editing factor PgeF [Pseudoxanthomonas sp. Root630]|uniref:peptidoglycan editing factor PgeF n=1 Tax=Pseudoxanthomonas sp. Root630 TaxID=1736574 RepID=UPI000702D669|nr:peptidoglycan editing factor PgeF [Pseudoxanthomonas sp. Root630]KRA46754.1 laccase [Pseudoxanthomonas sp. Root630]
MNRAPVVAADWPAPAGVHAFTTLRHGAGVSQAPFDHFNLGNKYAADGDDPAAVARNRAELAELAGLPSTPHWLKQVHGVDVVRVDAPAGPDAAEPEADALVTSAPGVVLAILTADCLPVVFAAKDGREIAAAHAGWPGLSKGMLEATLAAMEAPAADVVAWIGPAAGPQRYEVGGNVFDAFVSQDAGATVAFAPTRPGHWLADLPALARRRLVACGMRAEDIHGGDLCTISEPARFFSHRRDGRSGRIATLAWMQP